MLLERLALDALRVAVVVGLALAATLLLRRRAPAARRIVLATALAGALVMPAVSAVTPALNLPSPIPAARLHLAPVPEPLVDGAASPASEAAGPLPANAATPPAAALTPWHLDTSTVLLLVWALGAIPVLARLLLGLARSRSLVRRSTTARGWALAVARARKATGLRADVRVTGAVDAPAVTGLLRPVILVPPASSAWDDERRLAVLLHELAHVHQRDCLLQVVAQLACAMHWFDPLVWVAARRLRIERELSADEAVLAAGTRPSRYAEDLLAIASASWGSGDVPSGALGMGERSQLAARVTAIVSSDRVRRTLRRGHAASLVGASAVVVVGVACSTATTAGPAVPASDAPPPAIATAPAPATSSLAAASPAVSSVRPALQAIAEEELDRALADTGGKAATVLVLDPSTGEILADAGKANGAPADVAVRTVYEPGSTMKAITLAGALDDGVVHPDDRFDGERGAWTYQGKVLHDSHSWDALTLAQATAVSSNVVYAKVFDKLGGARFRGWLHAFHLGDAPPVDGAAAGSIPSFEEHSFRGAVAAVGEGLLASPLQVAAAYGAIANGGEYVAPTRTRRTGPAPRQRILREETARAVVGLLEGVVTADHATGGLAKVEGVSVAGKTGTAETALPGGGEGIYASFVGFVPSRAPRFVILVGVEQPAGEPSGGQDAAPVFARVATRALATN
ncbi:MAG TPA: penicillin-binding transpeptidase domain-containing protein [Polyangiaceae bacterium]|jgi:beta-lactamase regulating signal transducer with metallopeptidase domain